MVATTHIRLRISLGGDWNGCSLYQHCHCWTNWGSFCWCQNTEIMVLESFWETPEGRSLPEVINTDTCARYRSSSASFPIRWAQNVRKQISRSIIIEQVCVLIRDEMFPTSPHAKENEGHTSGNFVEFLNKRFRLLTWRSLKSFFDTLTPVEMLACSLIVSLLRCCFGSLRRIILNLVY